MTLDFSNTAAAATPWPVCRREDIRALEAAAANGPAPGLMARAGRAAADLARTLTGEGRGVLVLAGPGNNGGDALVAALHLKNGWHDVTVVFTGDEKRLPAPAADALRAWRAAGGTVLNNLPAPRRWDLVIDGLFGIGLTRPVEGAMAALMDKVEALNAPILALDIPSGLEADTGRILGRALRADHTLTFIALKPGLLTLNGPDLCGRLHLCGLGLERETDARAPGHTTHDGLIAAALPPRRHNTHKGSYGTVAIVGGGCGMTGAALLAGRAALQLGAGRVRVGLLDNIPAWDPLQPELMLSSAAAVLATPQLDVLVLGPGMGQTPDAYGVTSAALACTLPLVADADALNLIAAHPALQEAAVARKHPLFMTPHPAEAARLLGVTTADIQADRVRAACAIAARYRAAVVLKGAGSICAYADGRWLINTTGDPAMASAGMGDALSGIVGALLAQGAEADTALAAGVRLHGLAAEMAATKHPGPAITASEVIAAARGVAARISGAR